jgi:DNA polymerase III subunit beta
MTTATQTTTATATSTRRRNKPAPVAAILPDTPAFKLTVPQERLKRALGLALHTVAGKSMLPVVSNILLTTDGANHLKISATNLEIGIVVRIGAQIERPGAISLPARLLSDVVGDLPTEPVTLDMDSRTQSVQLTCSHFECAIKGIEADEFPLIPSYDSHAASATFAPHMLRSAIHQVAFAASADDTRPVLTGVHIALDGSAASFAAADGFRLTFRDVTLDEPVAAAQEVVIPARAMETLGKVLTSVEGDVELLLADDGNRVHFRAAGLELVSRTIDGRYPNVARYMELAFATVLEIDTKELAKAVKLASYFAAASMGSIRLSLEPGADGRGTLTLSANAAEVGENTSVHDVALRGAGGTVALNVGFLADAIAAITTPTIALYLNSAQQPVALKGVGDDSYTYVAMPMTVR